MCPFLCNSADLFISLAATFLVGVKILLFFFFYFDEFIYYEVEVYLPSLASSCQNLTPGGSLRPMRFTHVDHLLWVTERRAEGQFEIHMDTVVTAVVYTVMMADFYVKISKCQQA